MSTDAELHDATDLTAWEPQADTDVLAGSSSTSHDKWTIYFDNPEIDEIIPWTFVLAGWPGQNPSEIEGLEDALKEVGLQFVFGPRWFEHCPRVWSARVCRLAAEENADSDN